MKGNDVRDYFEMLSANSNPKGRAQFLDIYKHEASNILTQFIVERALSQVGGGTSGDALIEYYRKMLQKRLGK